MLSLTQRLSSRLLTGSWLYSKVQVTVIITVRGSSQQVALVWLRPMEAGAFQIPASKGPQQMPGPITVLASWINTCESLHQITWPLKAQDKLFHRLASWASEDKVWLVIFMQKLAGFASTAYAGIHSVSYIRSAIFSRCGCVNVPQGQGKSAVIFLLVHINYCNYMLPHIVQDCCYLEALVQDCMGWNMEWKAKW